MIACRATVACIDQIACILIIAVIDMKCNVCELNPCHDVALRPWGKVAHARMGKGGPPLGGVKQRLGVLKDKVGVASPASTFSSSGSPPSSSTSQKI
jgi:hypothetical protein